MVVQQSLANLSHSQAMRVKPTDLELQRKTFWVSANTAMKYS